MVHVHGCLSGEWALAQDTTVLVHPYMYIIMYTCTHVHVHVRVHVSVEEKQRHYTKHAVKVPL